MSTSTNSELVSYSPENNGVAKINSDTIGTLMEKYGTTDEECHRVDNFRDHALADIGTQMLNYAVDNKMDTTLSTDVFGLGGNANAQIFIEDGHHVRMDVRHEQNAAIHALLAASKKMSTDLLENK